MIGHVAIEIRRDDADACLHFWRLLGFEQIAPPRALAERAAWVQAAGTQIHLLFTEPPFVAPQGHVAVIAQDYDATLEALSAAGFTVQPRTEHWGSPRCFVRCPAGHRVEVMAFAPS